MDKREIIRWIADRANEHGEMYATDACIQHVTVDVVTFGDGRGVSVYKTCGTIGQAQAWADKAGQRIATRYYIVLPEGEAREAIKRKAIPAHIGIYGVTEDEEIVRVRNPQLKRRYCQRFNARIVMRDVMQCIWDEAQRQNRNYYERSINNLMAGTQDAGTRDRCGTVL